jgi:hypothetical protein
MKKSVVVFILLLSIVFNAQVYAQGCSDAGFCTIGSIKPQDSALQNIKKQKLTVVLANGIGDESVYVFTPGIQYDNQLSDRWAIQAKITVNYASGNLGNAFGLGDAYLSGTFSIKDKSSWKKSILFATKLPLNNGDIREGTKPLPMQYQSSLGTVDIIGGFSITNNKWAFATAFQQPLSGRNRNTFLPAYWNTAAASKYPPTNDFKRKGDVLLRAGYNVGVNKKFNINLGLLGIYHLGKDSYIDGNISNKPIEIAGSDGLTLNGTAAAWYRVSNKFSIGLTGGVPFVVRDVRPDGLTRKFVIAPEFIFHF